MWRGKLCAPASLRNRHAGGWRKQLVREVALPSGTASTRHLLPCRLRAGASLHSTPVPASCTVGRPDAGAWRDRARCWKAGAASSPARPLCACATPCCARPGSWRCRRRRAARRKAPSARGAGSAASAGAGRQRCCCAATFSRGGPGRGAWCARCDTAAHAEDLGSSRYKRW